MWRVPQIQARQSPVPLPLSLPLTAQDVRELAVHNGSPVVPVGLPIANYAFLVVDLDSVERGQPRLAADGDEGELWIAALGMGLGYLRRPGTRTWRPAAACVQARQPPLPHHHITSSPHGPISPRPD